MAGPWPFIKQAAKFGYQNNPNWTVDPAQDDKHFPCGYWHNHPMVSYPLPPGWQQNVIYDNGWYYGLFLHYDNDFYSIVKWNDSGEAYWIYSVVSDDMSIAPLGMVATENNLVFIVPDFENWSNIIYTVTKSGQLLNTYTVVNVDQTPKSSLYSAGNHVVYSAAQYNYVTEKYELYVRISHDGGLSWNSYAAASDIGWVEETLINSSGIVFLFVVGIDDSVDCYYGNPASGLTKVDVSGSTEGFRSAAINSDRLFYIYRYGTDLKLAVYNHSLALQSSDDVALSQSYAMQLAASETSLVLYYNNGKKFYRSTLPFSSFAEIYYHTYTATEFRFGYYEDRYIYTACALGDAGDELGYLYSTDDGLTWQYEDSPVNYNTWASVAKVDTEGVQPVWPFSAQPKKTTNNGYWPK